MGNALIIGIASADYLRGDKSPDGEEKWGGAGWARLGQYLPFYRAAGHQVLAGTLWKVNGKVMVEDQFHNRVETDVILMQRIMHDGVADTIKMGRANGQVIINDLDDWYWGLSPSNDAFAASHPKKRIVQYDSLGIPQSVENPEHVGNYGSNLAASSFLTVSTPYLAERISRRVKCPIVIVPNYIDVSRFTPVPLSPGEVPLVGWAGSTAHRSGDLETVAGVLRPRILDGSIRIHHSGAMPDDNSFADTLGVDPSLVSTTLRTNAADYPSLLTFDVGIVPLRDTPFNHAKSEIKGLEYAAAGIPFIAQGLSAYAQLHEDWNGAFWKADRPKDWVKGLQLHRDPQYRLDKQALLLDLVRQRDIEYGAKLWLDVIEGATK